MAAAAMGPNTATAPTLPLQPAHPDPHTFRITNDFHNFTWNYPNYAYIYCTDGYDIPGERNVLIGTIYIVQYLFYLVLYTPTLIVMARRPLINYACYKLMFVVGVGDNVGGFIFA